MSTSLHLDPNEVAAYAVASLPPQPTFHGYNESQALSSYHDMCVMPQPPQPTTQYRAPVTGGRGGHHGSRNSSVLSSNSSIRRGAVTSAGFYTHARQAPMGRPSSGAPRQSPAYINTTQNYPSANYGGGRYQQQHSFNMNQVWLVFVKFGFDFYFPSYSQLVVINSTASILVARTATTTTRPAIVPLAKPQPHRPVSWNRLGLESTPASINSTRYHHQHPSRMCTLMWPGAVK